VEAGQKDKIAIAASKNGFAKENLKKMSDEVIFLEEIAYIAEPEGVVALLRGMKEREDSNELLRTSSLPQLFILGKKDNYIPLERAEQMVADHPQAKVAWLENSGHLGYFEEPEACAAALLDFMKGE
jgi:pimeloyl-ACP methyl ester carboxylesterase